MCVCSSVWTSAADLLNDTSLVCYIERILFKSRISLVYCTILEAMLAVQLEAQTYGLTVEIIVQQSVLGRVMYACVSQRGVSCPSLRGW